MVTALSSLIVSHNVLTHANELAGFSVVTMKQYLLLRLLSLTEVDIKWMGKHREECRKNYFKKWQKMLKERKAQGENPTSHLQEEKRSSSPRESIVKNLIARKKEAMKVMKPFCANAKYHTLGDLPPKLQFDPICKLRGRRRTTITFSPSAMSSGGMIFSWSLDTDEICITFWFK